MRCLAAGNGPLGGFSLVAQNKAKMHAPPSDNEQPQAVPGNFPENTKTDGIHRDESSSYISWYIIERQNKLTITTPLTWVLLL